MLALILGSVSAQIHWTSFKMLLLIWTILGGMALVCGLFLIEATLSFFSVKRIELVNILTYGGRSTCQYPIDILSKGAAAAVHAGCALRSDHAFAHRVHPG